MALQLNNEATQQVPRWGLMRITSILAKGGQRKWLPSLIFGTIVGAVIFAAILVWAGLDNVWNNFGNLDYWYLAIYVGLAVCTYLLRAWRFRLLVDRGTISKFYGIVSIHTLMVNLLPFSSGEISYPLLLRRYGISNGFLQGIPSLVVARSQDVLINASLALLALILAGSLGLLLGKAGGSLLLGVGLVALVVGIAWLVLHKGLDKDSRIAKRINEYVSQGLSSFKNTPLKVWAVTFLMTVVIRIISLIGIFYLFESVGVSLPLPSVFLITSLYVFLPLLPVNTLAGVGITEAYLLTFFVIGGIDQGVATAASIQIHSIQLVVAAALGALGLLLLQLLKTRTLGETKMVPAGDPVEEV